jgi:hypothetical protein
MPVLTSHTPSHPPPLWQTEGSLRLLVIGAMCILPIAAVSNLIQGLPWRFPNWVELALTGLNGWMLLAGLLSFALTPVTIAVGAWSIFKSKIDKRIKVIMAWFLLAQLATALILLVMLFMAGGRLPH